MAARKRPLTQCFVGGKRVGVWWLAGTMAEGVNPGLEQRLACFR